MRSPVKKQEREGKPARKREEEDSSSKEEVDPLRKCMGGAVPPQPIPTPPVVPSVQATPRRDSGQSVQSPSVNVDNFIDLETLNRMIDEDNAKATRRAELEKERERKEVEELLPRLKACMRPRRKRKDGRQI